MWRHRANWSPDNWTFTGAVFVDGKPVGVQDLEAEHFRAVRSVETGSWLGRAHQGQGLGREMREAILHLAFAGLGAEEALSGAFEDNAASLATSRAVGLRGERRGERAPPRRLGPHHPLPPGPGRLGAAPARRHRDRRARRVPRHVRRLTAARDVQAGCRARSRSALSRSLSPNDAAPRSNDGFEVLHHRERVVEMVERGAPLFVGG